jgi:hypothetical protein
MGQKKRRVLGEEIFCPQASGGGSASPPVTGWQLKFGVRIFLKKSSDFVQDRQQKSWFVLPVRSPKERAKEGVVAPEQIRTVISYVHVF